jgi:crossover junction endodeoxyribonuclease RusA
LSACFKNAKRVGRAKTARYKNWIAITTPQLKKQIQWRRPDFFHEKIIVIYSLKRPDKRIRDLGNLEKALSDILVSTGIIEDDSNIEDLRLHWADQEHAVIINIREFDNETH